MFEAVELALALGIDVNIANANGDTALHVAAARGYDTVIELLVAAGASSEITNDDGQTPLEVARSGSRRLGVRWATARQSTVDLLRSLGAN